MNTEFDNFRPIYIQIIEEMKLKIVSGKYKSNEQLPSVRALAIDFKVNPNTVQRAYSELERCGLVYTDRTNGRFVTENETLIKTLRKSLAKEKIEFFLSDMENLGLNRNEIINYLENK